MLYIAGRSGQVLQCDTSFTGLVKERESTFIF